MCSSELAEESETEQSCCMIEKNDISFISCHFVRLLLFRKQQNDVFSLSQFSCTAFYFPWKKVGTQKAADAQTPSFTMPSTLCFAALTAEILLLVLVIYRVKTKPRNAFSSPMKNILTCLYKSSAKYILQVSNKEHHPEFFQHFAA